jgi:hypothetical protein
MPGDRDEPPSISAPISDIEYRHPHIPINNIRYRYPNSKFDIGHADFFSTRSTRTTSQAVCVPNNPDPTPINTDIG